MFKWICLLRGWKGIRKFSTVANDSSYHPISNPDGILNLGKASNYLMENEVSEKLEEIKYKMQREKQHAYYYKLWGLTRLRRHLAKFMTKFFKSPESIDYNHLTILTSVTASIDLLGYCLADPHDVFLVPTPAYSGLFQEACTKSSRIDVVPVPLKHDSEAGRYFDLTVKDLEDAVLQQIDKGRVVRGIFLTNPNNPLGRVYSPQLIWDIMNFCKRYELHLVSNEVYCLSVFDEQTDFHSVLQFEPNSLPDPERVHCLWGFTKDLCLSGFRTGVIHTRSENLLAGLRAASLYLQLSLPVQKLLTSYISDHDWIENVFLKQNHERMRDAYSRAKDKLESIGVIVFPAKAGFFFFCSFKRFLRDPLEKSARELFEEFVKNKVYLVPHLDMKCEEPGWMRIIFTVDSQIFDIGFERIKFTLEEWSEKYQIVIEN